MTCSRRRGGRSGRSRFPQLLPAIVAGFLLSFTFAFDDYLITTFVNGRGTSTIPLYVFGQIRKGVTPATNAVAALMLMVTLGILLIGQWVLTRQARRSGESGGGVAGIVAENAGG
jgi:spermidine/putrescine transport system permease protein